MGKTCGMEAGRKLKRLRINQRWADKQYKKSHLGNEWKKPSTCCAHAKGIVLEKIGNSAIRVQLENGKTITAFVPNDDSLKYIKENDKVWMNRKGHAVGDIPRYKVGRVI